MAKNPQELARSLAHERAKRLTKFVNVTTDRLIADHPPEPSLDDPLSSGSEGLPARSGQIPWPAPDAPERVAESEQPVMHPVLDECFQTLTEEQRFVMLQHVVEGLTFPEIAKNLRCVRGVPTDAEVPNEDSVRQQYHRGLRKLRRCLKERGISC